MKSKNHTDNESESEKCKRKNKQYDLDNAASLEGLAEEIFWWNDSYNDDDDDEQEEKEDWTLYDHVVDNEIKACFKNCSLDGIGHVVIPGLRGVHIDRYITDGRRTEYESKLLSDAKALVRDAKVNKITKEECNNGRWISTKVIGEANGIYGVSIKFKSRTFLTDPFIATLDISKCYCKLLKGANENDSFKGCGKNSKCKHVAAFLYSMRDPSSLQKPLQTSSTTPFKVKNFYIVFVHFSFLGETFFYFFFVIHVSHTGNKTFICNRRL